MEEQGMIFGGRHYGARRDYDFVEVLGGPVTGAALADAIDGKQLPSRGRSIEVDGELVLSCGDADCTERVVDALFGGMVPAGTRVVVDAWPCPGDECACRAWAVAR